LAAGPVLEMSFIVGRKGEGGGDVVSREGGKGPPTERANISGFVGGCHFKKGSTRRKGKEDWTSSFWREGGKERRYLKLKTPGILG